MFHLQKSNFKLSYNQSHNFETAKLRNFIKNKTTAEGVLKLSE